MNQEAAGWPAGAAGGAVAAGASVGLEGGDG